MRSLLAGAMLLGLVATAFGQGRGGPYWSLGGFGNVVYPGTGHAPQMPAGGFNAPVFRGGRPGRGPVSGPISVGHQFHRRQSIVPYPVFYGYGYGYGDFFEPPASYPQAEPEQAPPIINTNSAPAVVINQSFVPPQANPVVREYNAPPPPAASPDDQTPDRTSPASAARQRYSDEPTLYLIAFKDHSIAQALGYWMEGPNLHYVTVDHALNQASMDLIDRDLSQRLNSERGVEFKLPAR